MLPWAGLLKEVEPLGQACWEPGDLSPEGTAASEASKSPDRTAGKVFWGGTPTRGASATPANAVPTAWGAGEVPLLPLPPGFTVQGQQDGLRTRTPCRSHSLTLGGGKDPEPPRSWLGAPTARPQGWGRCPGVSAGPGRVPWVTVQCGRRPTHACHM